MVGQDVGSTDSALCRSVSIIQSHKCTVVLLTYIPVTTVTLSLKLKGGGLEAAAKAIMPECAKGGGQVRRGCGEGGYGIIE